MSKDSSVAKDSRFLAKKSKEKRADNKQKSTTILTNLGIPFTSRNNGVHLIIGYQSKTIDFYPSTGVWIYRGSPENQRGRGIFELLKSFGISTEKKDYGNHYVNPG